jgi:hypothetical protein
MVRMEWLILELLVLAWAVYELVSVRRSIRKDRAAKQSAAAPETPSE